MSYSIVSLYSGSKGNSTFISFGETKILIDAGKCTSALLSSLNEIGESIENIDAIFITHEHNDHIGSLKVLLKKYDIPVHIVEASARKIPFICEDLYVSKFNIHPPLFEVNIKGVKIKSFPSPHDSNYCVGYTVEGEIDGVYKKVGYATDVGYITNDIHDSLLGAESVIIESNHDEMKLRFGPYPEDLKNRIASKHGHLSNRECAEFSSELYKNGTKNFLLAHLSEENNEPSLAYDEVFSSIGDDKINIKVAEQDYCVKLV